jgi:hypothetical protein
VTRRATLAVIGLDVGLALVALGVFLPWARVAGDERAGATLANSLLGLPDADQVQGLAVLGLCWYAIPLLALATWLSQFRHWPPRLGWLTRILGLALLAATAAFYAWLVVRDAGGPRLGANLALAGALVAAVSAFVSPGGVPGERERNREGDDGG